MINDLKSIDWTSMGHAYGPAGDVPQWLRDMASPDTKVREQAFSSFYGAAHHQGDVYPCTVASLSFLFTMADSPSTPDRAAVVGLIVSIGREAVDSETLGDIWISPAGEEHTAYQDAAGLIRGRREAFVGYACDADARVRSAAIPGLGLFLEDAERAVGVLRDRLDAEDGVMERLLVIRTMGDLALRLPAAQEPAQACFDLLADHVTVDADVRLAALVQRARCVPDSIDDTTVPTAISLLRRISPIPRPEDSGEADASPGTSGPCTCALEAEPDPGVPGHVAAAFADLDRRNRVHAPTTSLLKTFHEVLDARVEDRTVLLCEQLGSPDAATRYDAIDMARGLITAWRGDHTRLVRLLAECLLPHDSYTSAAAAEVLGSLGRLAEPAREALAAYVTTHRATHRPDAWASPHAELRRAHQQAVLALAELGDERALPSLLTALDTGIDAWRAVNAAGRLPQAAAELTPRLIRLLADIDHSREWPDVSPTSLASALAALGDPTAVPVLTHAIAAAVQRGQWRTAEPVLEALASFGPRAVTALETVRLLVEVEDEGTRTAAAHTLWELERRPEHVVPLLQRLLDDKRNFDAVNLAGRIGPPAAAVLPRLRQMLNDQLKQNARNEQDGSAVLNDSWTLVHVAAALWDIGGDEEADVVVPTLLAAWKDNDSTARHALACLDRMGPAAHPALPQIRTALAQPRRGDNAWGWNVAVDLEIQHTGQTILTRTATSQAPS
ncbi:HEAT repeat domain-containing protein [Streptomyces sp. MB09-01]|uniref:HEAT repeat domain-containing protein n=1 Tax=Streptomyces sp. MB09-01 TaxID=3028666 RepID=UPI0029AE7F27|nr:HEAT repeat domain-containing protein [Streptomyces sp. MB09-01]MDX3540607.1 HEAT repeat domain-containing protein [Streptomyces sp. MB09-01]